MAPRAPQIPPEQSCENPQTIDRIETYRKLSSITDKDALHSVIAIHGAQILDKGLPYVLIAARNWQRSAHRRTAAHPEVPVTDLPEPASLWDPFQELEQKESLRALASAFSQLDNQDVLVVWRHAEGYTDIQIQQEWDALGFEPRTPSEEYLRKRRQRARERLKTLLS
jgi:hypothetical protein